LWNSLSKNLRMILDEGTHIHSAFVFASEYEDRRTRRKFFAPCSLRRERKTQEQRTYPRFTEPPKKNPCLLTTLFKNPESQAMPFHGRFMTKADKNSYYYQEIQDAFSVFLIYYSLGHEWYGLLFLR